MLCRQLTSKLDIHNTGFFLQYKSVERVLSERPTAVMMAHVNPLKDIVTAIRAAKLIVEEYKVTGISSCFKHP